MFACRIFGLRATDVMQGVVYGTRFMGSAADHPADPALHTRLDFDQAFGTALNRFCCQSAIGEPLTLFGKGNQRRGFLPIRDSMQCLALAVDNPPEAGDYRVFNQFEETYTVSELAAKVASVARRLGLDPRIRRIREPAQGTGGALLQPGPRPPAGARLPARPATWTRNSRRCSGTCCLTATGSPRRATCFLPDIRWDGSRRKSRFLDTAARQDEPAGLDGSKGARPDAAAAEPPRPEAASRPDRRTPAPP